MHLHETEQTFVHITLKHPCSDFMDMLRRLISCRIIIIIIIIIIISNSL